MKTRSIIPHVSTLLKNELGLTISLLFREELITMKKIIDAHSFYHHYHTYMISKEIEAKIDPMIISLLLTDVQRYNGHKTNMAALLDSAETTLLYPGNNTSPGIRELYRDILQNLIQPVPVTVDGKIVTLDFDGDVKTTARFLKKRDPESKYGYYPDYKWYQAPGDKLRSTLK